MAEQAAVVGRGEIDDRRRAPQGAQVLRDFRSVAECAAAYAQALDTNDASGALASAEAVLAARIDLVRCLVEAGWLPPPGALRAWTEDVLLLTEQTKRASG